jgi:hypothetical protein
MLTFKQWCSAKRKITQEQRAQIPDTEGARNIVGKMISDALVQNDPTPDGLCEEDVDQMFNSQPVHFDGLGYVPHCFQKDDIRLWGKQMNRYRLRSGLR